jgi:hypothetical protein
MAGSAGGEANEMMGDGNRCLDTRPRRSEFYLSFFFGCVYWFRWLELTMMLITFQFVP